MTGLAGLRSQESLKSSSPAYLLRNGLALTPPAPAPVVGQMSSSCHSGDAVLRRARLTLISATNQAIKWAHVSLAPFTRDGSLLLASFQDVFPTSFNGLAILHGDLGIKRRRHVWIRYGWVPEALNTTGIYNAQGIALARTRSTRCPPAKYDFTDQRKHKERRLLQCKYRVKLNRPTASPRTDIKHPTCPPCRIEAMR